MSYGIAKLYSLAFVNGSCMAISYVNLIKQVEKNNLLCFCSLIKHQKRTHLYFIFLFNQVLLFQIIFICFDEISSTNCVGIIHNKIKRAEFFHLNSALLIY